MQRAPLILLGLILLPQTATADPLAPICERFSEYDRTKDGVVEIESLRVLPAPTARKGKLVLVLVEDRLLQPLAKHPELDLRPALRRHAADLIAEGFRPRVVATRLYRGKKHQDGETLLALREFLKATRKADPSLRGAVLVGAFPDGLLVRTCNWIRRRPVVLFRRTKRQKKLPRVWHLRSYPEITAHRCDIILGDLDGDWAGRYRRGRTRLPRTIGVFPQGVPKTGGVATEYERSTFKGADFFLVDDGKLHLTEVPGKGLKMVPRWSETDDECTPADKKRKNPIAQPEIYISRLNARGVALSPNTRLRDAKGRAPLDASGRPQRLEFRKKVPHWAHHLWRFDPLLERRLLLEYFARNHRFRRGYMSAKAFVPASVSKGLRSGIRTVRRGHRTWRRFNAPGYDAREANLVGLIEWLKRPAALRTVRAHSNRWGSKYARAPIPALQRAAGGVPWCWTRRGKTLVPSLAAASGRGMADFFLYRTLWANGIRPTPHLMIHIGCEAISPGNAERVPWSHPGYGLRQGGEALLFYAGTLALVGRAKVFYDSPRGFAQVLSKGKTMGEAWARYFEVESRGPTFRHVGGRVGRKRSYFWSLLGDWTLRLRKPRKWY